MTTDQKILFLGCGKMGGAIVKSLINKKFSPTSFSVVKPTQNNQIPNIKYYSSCADLPKDYKADVIFFAFKPQDSFEILNNLLKVKPYQANTIFISILAGKKISFFEGKLGLNKKIVRIMPNLPTLIGEGISSYCHNSNVKDSEISHLLQALGKNVKLDQEEFIDAATAIAGSGPAYLFLFIKTMIDSARKLGLSNDMAVKMVKQTIYGSAKMALETDLPMEQLIADVTSKGGTTEAALEVLLSDDILDSIMIQAINAACNRSKILSNQ
ncbi:MAG: pyrroline-5-carboxylate reductase [Proteobacteria bacterium]|nr:pyrroline-5-carboxylate reductase [Pseudomonadota bacterium]